MDAADLERAPLARRVGRLIEFVRELQAARSSRKCLQFDGEQIGTSRDRDFAAALRVDEYETRDFVSWLLWLEVELDDGSRAVYVHDDGPGRADRARWSVLEAEPA